MTTGTTSVFFDYGLPFGPLSGTDGEVVCSAGRKSVGFTGKARIIGYNYFVALSPLNPDVKSHVWSLKMSGMVLEYGFNAIAIVVMHPDRRLVLDASHPEDVKIDSQDFAPYSTTVVTCVLSGSILKLYTSDGRAPVTLVRGGIFCKAYDLNGLKLEGALPMLGLRMDCSLGNAVDIVSTPHAVSQLIKEAADGMATFYD
eukprot:7380564-Prymnesium_polylepis.1